MTIFSKIKIFLLLLVLLPGLQSCRKEVNDVIPDVFIDFYISLSDPQFFNLTAPLNSVYVDQNTNNIGPNAAGFDENGIIIYRASEDEFYAYDRTCPHDYEVNGLSVKVNILDQIYAECPECKSKYALPNFGTPLSGSVGRYPLKNYKTSFDGLRIRVWNHP